LSVNFFFFQAEDGIRDKLVTGVQTCALPISNTVWYYGGITERTDVELIAYAARSMPHHRFVLIGRNEGADVSALTALPNIILVGEVPYQQLPSFLHAFDVCILPYRCCDRSLASDPIKV